jgi:hypothetical protein
MATLQTLYMMTFTPEKMDKDALMGMCQAATQMLSAKNQAFARRMNMLDDSTRMIFSSQLFALTMHTPQTMQTTLAGWLSRETDSFAPRLGDNFFPHGMRDSKGRENYILFYFDFK